ncbi:Glucose dehydrogenase [FAD, quinone] [Orchesella cincta]|uniref:Glucose dehydrogenase [FAD, quinone] n=1 Tax=Orchesella cincta TaxID=48709 RepID=A0A1D2N400_ORCCI|nr:Glucose dehydrogenase [FAD, quinone] [Orchesella cincta]
MVVMHVKERKILNRDETYIIDLKFIKKVKISETATNCGFTECSSKSRFQSAMGILSAFRFAFQNLFFTPILYGVIASLAVFSTVWDNGDRFKDQLTDRFRSQDDTFDFVIVGGGSAGAVLANRLSEFHTVLLLEAGGESHPFQAIPGLSIFLSKQPGTDWMHKSVTQSKSCFACRHKVSKTVENDAQCSITRQRQLAISKNKYIFSQGKNLGGTGNLNYLMHLRGNPLDFDNWATITGDPTWGYDGVLPYFIRSEHFVGETTDKNAHGYGGPLQIQIPDCVGLAEEWNRAGVEMGYPHIDLNGRHTEGFDTVFYPIKTGVRQATYRSYIQPARNRPSLLIRKFAHVNKVILIREGKTSEATGVEYDRHGHRKFAFANKEVILSAGSLQSPKLLILSGIGQQEHLKALRIPAKSILPVGKNLQDHFSTLLGPFYINKARTISFDRDIDKQSFVNFASNGKGPLTTSGFQAAAVLASTLAKAQGQGGWPDLQLTLFGLTPHRMFYSDIGHAFGIREDILRRYYGDATGKENAFFIMVTLTRPLSKGDICVAANNPYKPAVIRPSYVCDDLGHDIKVLTEGIHRALYLAENTTTFQALETTYSHKCFPGCENVPFRSEAYWECYIRSFSIANGDHVGTCAMGKVGSPYAVVDPELRVQGIDRLRVVDASVMPTIVGVPTQASTIMIAEKGAALILNRWKDEVKVGYGPPKQLPGNP